MESLTPETIARIRRHPGPDVGAQLLSPYNLVIRFDSGSVIEVGRFSGNVLPQIRIFSAEGAKTLLRVASFCEFASDSAVLIGGAHRNASLFNYTFGAAYSLRQYIPVTDKALAAPVPSIGSRIGRGVTVSTGALVLDGADIGIGSIIAANAVVRGVVEPFSLSAGVPARPVARRFSAEFERLYQEADIEKVRAHDLIKVPALLRDLENGHVTIAEVMAALTFMEEIPTVYLTADIAAPHRLMVRKNNFDYKIGGRPVESPNLRARLDTYFNQIWSDTEEYIWSPDIFHKLGIS